MSVAAAIVTMHAAPVAHAAAATTTVMTTADIVFLVVLALFALGAGILVRRAPSYQAPTFGRTDDTAPIVPARRR